MLRSTSLRVLRPEDLPAVTDLLTRDPVTDVFVASRVEAVGLDPARLGGEMWGFAVDGYLESLCHAGANMVPVQAGPDAVRGRRDRAVRRTGVMRDHEGQDHPEDHQRTADDDQGGRAEAPRLS